MTLSDPLRPNPTPADVRAFYAWFSRQLRFRVIRKNNSALMQTVARVLDAMKVVDKKRFLENFTTVIPIRGVRGVFVPFEHGVPAENWSLWHQIEILDHEADHLMQSDKAGDISYAWDYLTSSARRAHYEAGGYRCNLELRWRYFRELLDPKALAEKLVGNYGCSRADAAVTAKELALTIPTVKLGALVEPASRIAVPWLDARFAR
jgi:hypothetical protein